MWARRKQNGTLPPPASWRVDGGRRAAHARKDLERRDLAGERSRPAECHCVVDTVIRVAREQVARARRRVADAEAGVAGQAAATVAVLTD